MIIDVHAHLDLLKDLENVIKRAKENNIVTIITNGLNHETNLKSIELKKKYDIVETALGVYPSYGIELNDNELNEEIKFISENSPFAIGEVGLDFTYPNKEKQIKVFKKFIELAKNMDLPIIVHTRNAEKECIDLLEKSKINKVILHCFKGDKELINRAIKNNFSFSIPAIILKSNHFEELVKLSPIENLLTETDCPFLSPYSGKKNEPSFITETIKRIAQIKRLDPIEVENLIFLNFQRIFLKR